MSVNFGFIEDKKPVLNGGKLNGDLDADNWPILNVPVPTKSHAPSNLKGSVIPIGIICRWSGAAWGTTYLTRQTGFGR